MLTEADVRVRKIDEQLARAGWSEERATLAKEFFLKGTLAPKQVRELPGSYESGDERLDYLLFGSDGKPLAVVEAKRNGRDPLEGKRQAEDYADHIFARYHVRPFIFLSNGDVHLFYDRERGYPPREVSDFFTREDLERLVFQRLYAKPLDKVKINLAIAGKGDRLYQREAIEHITAAMERRERKFLLVMATGTGKTRTIIGLVDLLLRARWVQRVLFLADRRALVRQAQGEFTTHLPFTHRTRIEGGEIDHDASIHLATYPSMMQVYKQLSPGYYDLVIADESHRSIYNFYKGIFDHFDAMQLGLTATPTDYIDHNTYQLFRCADGMPTYHYPYETAVKDHVLVSFKTLASQTTFQVDGIKAENLSPELQRSLEQQHINLEDVDFEGSDLERRVTNTGTTDALVREFMEKSRKDASGTLPAKSIIFAISHHHALEIQRSFYRLYPDKPWLAEVIDSRMERAEKLLDDFKYKDTPRVAISVDMLDTGIDVPAIQNLVFAKPVFSLIKFWQMIGRGTRRWTDALTGTEKESFLIIDHWRNFDFFQINPEGETPSLTTPLPVSLFRLRLEKLALFLRLEKHEAAAQTVEQLQHMLALLPHDNPDIHPHQTELDRLASTRAWENLTEQMEHLQKTIAPLLRFLPDVNLLSVTFEIETEQLALALLEQKPERAAKVREHILHTLSLLPTGLPQVQERQADLRLMTSDGFWTNLTYERILDLQTTWKDLVRFRQRQHKTMLTLHLPDSISSRRWIVYGPSGEGAFVDHYRGQVETYIKELADEYPPLYKVKHASTEETPSLATMQMIADTLNRPDLFITEAILRQIYERSDVGLLDFLRHILGTQPLQGREERVKAAFDAFLTKNPNYTVTQANFLRAICSFALRTSRLQPEDLEHQPFSRIGSVHRLFTREEVETIITFTNQQVA